MDQAYYEQVARQQEYEEWIVDPLAQAEYLVWLEQINGLPAPDKAGFTGEK